MTTDPAVQAAAEALMSVECNCPPAASDDIWRVILPDCPACGDAYAKSKVAVAAARPIIEAEVRKRIAADIEAEYARLSRPEWLQGMAVAARIARGES